MNISAFCRGAAAFSFAAVIGLYSHSSFGHAQFMMAPHPDDPNPAAFNSPLPRMDSDVLKNPAPCGVDGGKQAPKRQYVAGSTVKFHFKETINHTGVFRIDMSSDNDLTFQRLIAADMNDPADAGIVRAVGKLYSVDVQIPNQVCANCTIRMTQSMGQLDNGNDYFSCADVAIVAAPVNPPPDDPPPANDDEPAPQNTGSNTSSSNAPPGSVGATPVPAPFCGLVVGAGGGFFGGSGGGPSGGATGALMLLPFVLLGLLRLRKKKFEKAQASL